MGSLYIQMLEMAIDLSVTNSVEYAPFVVSNGRIHAETKQRLTAYTACKIFYLRMYHISASSSL